MDCSPSVNSPSCHVQGNKIYIKLKRKLATEGSDESPARKRRIWCPLPVCKFCGTGKLHGHCHCVQCNVKFEELLPCLEGKVDFRFSTTVIKAYKKLLVLKTSPVEFCSNPQSPDMNVSFDSSESKELMYAFDKLKTDHTFSHLSTLNGMSISEIYSHLIHVRAEHFHNYLRSLVQRLVAHPMNRSIFNSPVDPIALNIPNYFNVIRNPMDLGTIKTKLQQFQYNGVEDFSSDVRLVFSNAILYNPPNHPVTQSAEVLSEEFESEMIKITDKIARDDERVDTHKNCTLCNGEPCELCGEKCVKFEPPLVTCTASCRSRIKRAAPYFVSQDGLIWCQKCYGAINSHQAADPPDGQATNSVQKKDLVKRTHNCEVYEEWIQCGRCKKKFHEVCAMYNSRMRSECNDFKCIFCIIEDVYSNPNLSDMCKTNPHNSSFSTSKIPHTDLSRFIEGKVRCRLQELGHGSVGCGVKVRIVSDCHRTFCVQEELRAFFAQAPETLTYNSKCIMMFQEIDGMDVCLFSMYVQEYTEGSHELNQNLVYIAYLDSVEFFRPRPVRTDVYHEVVISYLGWAGCNGFKKAYIWACPPQRGNSFIFWCHPFHQRTPSKERLLRWYGNIVKRACALGVVGSSSNLYEEHFKNLCLTGAKESSAETDKCPPIFDGDFWVEQILRISERQQKSLRASSSSPHDVAKKILNKNR
mmetsp:Transcript_35404/g.46735  ORF Transcript_35404/g.46735 Transcript_35404/m.46735 type:complete len:696 (+) Transcript_35404:156-2243(+)